MIEPAVIMSAIPTGKENAIHMDQLVKKFGVSRSLIKKSIQYARRTCDGQVSILSGVEGYWMSDDDTEKQIFVDRLRREALTRFVSVKNTRHELRKMKGQMELEV